MRLMFNIALASSLLIHPAFAAYGQTIRAKDGLETGGERAKQDAYYRRLIAAHATFAVLTFVVVFPLSIISTRYTKHLEFQKNGGWRKKHALLNTFGVVFIVIVFVLGYLAVGTTDNVFDNVHHRIGLTIFIAILLQFFGGLINSFILFKPHVRTPLQNRLHIVFGWLIFGLGVAQIPVGMVLYGSPRWAFGLFGLAGGLVAITLFALEIVIGRREDHNIIMKTYKQCKIESAANGNSEQAWKVNWNGEIASEKRIMMGFGKKG